MKEIEFDDYKISLLDHSDSNAFFQLIESNRVRLEDFFCRNRFKNKNTRRYYSVLR
jgi:hypothetical protein